MRAFLFLLALFSSVSVYADCSCDGDVYLRVVYQKNDGASQDVRAFGRSWPKSQIDFATPIEKFKKQLETGASFEVVIEANTQPIYVPNNGIIHIPFVVHTGKTIDKGSVTNIKYVEVISTGCSAFPSPVRRENLSILTDTKPVKVEPENNQQFGGTTYRVFFNKHGKLIWLRYFPKNTGRCMSSVKADNVEVWKDACPYEGCQYGTWKTLGAQTVYDKPYYEPKKIGMIKGNTEILAKTGNWYISPGKALIRDPVKARKYGIDPIKPLGYLGWYGEMGTGHFVQNGKKIYLDIDVADMTGSCDFNTPLAKQPEWKRKRFAEVCWIQVVQEPTKTWWVLVTDPTTGTKGWIESPNVLGSDAFE